MNSRFLKKNSKLVLFVVLAITIQLFVACLFKWSAWTTSSLGAKRSPGLERQSSVDVADKVRDWLLESDRQFEELCQSLSDPVVAPKLDNKLLSKVLAKSSFHRFNYILQDEKTLSCDNYLSQKVFVDTAKPVNEMEQTFSVAFGFLVYHNFHQVEQLFRAVYRPQNYYCFNVDSNADDSFKQLVRFAFPFSMTFGDVVSLF